MMRARCWFQAWLVFQAAAVGAAQAPAVAASPARKIVVISDLHLGLGQGPAGWSPYEDFRWPVALRTFLAFVDQWSGGGTDLVIAGDLFELWQHPDVPCVSGDDDCGCTIAEAESIASTIASAHAAELALLRDFAGRRGNRVHVVPGNHDAALLLPTVWQRLRPSLGDGVVLAEEGRWVSPDQTVVVEHGHQIGKEVNSYPDWPTVVRACGGRERLVLTWGESGVQALFNDTERDYPIIDNIQPLSAALRHHRGIRGFTGTAADLTRVLMFNLFETSVRQKLALGPADAEGGKLPRWNEAVARGHGYRLFADALPAADENRQLLLLGEAEEWKGVRRELDRLAAEAAPEQVFALCDRVALLSKEEPDVQRVSCTDRLGAGAVKLVFGERLLARHLEKIQDEHVLLQLFVMGHTHDAHARRWVKLANGTYVATFNTGAFQRLITEEQFLAKAAAKGLAAPEALARLPLEELSGCMPAVFIDFVDGVPRGEVKNWSFDPATGAAGPLPACDDRCSLAQPRLCESE